MTNAPAPRSRKALRALLVVLALLLAAFGGVTAWAVHGVRVPPWRQYDGKKLPDGFLEPNSWAKKWWGVLHASDLPFAHREVTCASPDGKTLRGWLFDAKAPTDAAVLLVHGGGTDRRSMLKYATFLHDAGYAVAAFDCRDHGLSDIDRGGITFGKREGEDVVAQTAFLASAGFKRIAALGDSVGGVAAIEAAGREPRIGAVIAQNAYADFRDFVADILQQRGAPRPFGALVARCVELTWPAPSGNVRAEDTIATLAPRPVLILHGEADELTPVEHAKRLYAAANEPKELWIMPGAHHATLWNTDRAAFEGRVLAFLAKGGMAP